MVLVDRIANCLGCPRGDAVGGLAALWTQIELFINRAPEGIDRQDLRSSMMQKALEPPSSRGRHMLSCPPGTATVSRAFLHEDDDCWSALTNADDATEDLMKIEKILPGALTAINKFRAGDAAPSGKGAGRGAGKGDGGGGGKVAVVAAAKASLSAVPPTTPTPHHQSSRRTKVSLSRRVRRLTTAPGRRPRAVLARTSLPSRANTSIRPPERTSIFRTSLSTSPSFARRTA